MTTTEAPPFPRPQGDVAPNRTQSRKLPTFTCHRVWTLRHPTLSLWTSLEGETQADLRDRWLLLPSRHHPTPASKRCRTSTFGHRSGLRPIGPSRDFSHRFNVCLCLRPRWQCPPRLIVPERHHFVGAAFHSGMRLHSETTPGFTECLASPGATISGGAVSSASWRTAWAGALDVTTSGRC